MYFWVVIDFICVMKLALLYFSIILQVGVFVCKGRTVCWRGNTCSWPFSILIRVANATGKKNDRTCKQSKDGTFFCLVNYDDQLDSRWVIPLLFLERVPMYLGYFFSCEVYYKEPWARKDYKYRNHMKRILWFWLFLASRK
jgi:hypothetical protein